MAKRGLPFHLRGELYDLDNVNDTEPVKENLKLLRQIAPWEYPSVLRKLLLSVNNDVNSATRFLSFINTQRSKLMVDEYKNLTISDVEHFYPQYMSEEVMKNMPKAESNSDQRESKPRTDTGGNKFELQPVNFKMEQYLTPEDIEQETSVWADNEIDALKRQMSNKSTMAFAANGPENQEEDNRSLTDVDSVIDFKIERKTRTVQKKGKISSEADAWPGHVDVSDDEKRWANVKNKTGKSKILPSKTNSLWAMHSDSYTETRPFPTKKMEKTLIFPNTSYSQKNVNKNDSQKKPSFVATMVFEKSNVEHQDEKHETAFDVWENYLAADINETENKQAKGKENFGKYNSALDKTKNITDNSGPTEHKWFSKSSINYQKDVNSTVQLETEFSDDNGRRAFIKCKNGKSRIILHKTASVSGVKKNEPPKDAKISDDQNRRAFIKSEKTKLSNNNGPKKQSTSFDTTKNDRKPQEEGNATASKITEKSQINDKSGKTMENAQGKAKSPRKKKKSKKTKPDSVPSKNVAKTKDKDEKGRQ